MTVDKYIIIITIYKPWKSKDGLHSGLMLMDRFNKKINYSNAFLVDLKELLDFYEVKET